MRPSLWTIRNWRQSLSTRLVWSWKNKRDMDSKREQRSGFGELLKPRWSRGGEGGEGGWMFGIPSTLGHILHSSTGTATTRPTTIDFNNVHQPPPFWFNFVEYFPVVIVNSISSPIWAISAILSLKMDNQHALTFNKLELRGKVSLECGFPKKILDAMFSVRAQIAN